MSSRRKRRRKFIFEHRHQDVLPPLQFYARLLRTALVAAAVVFLSLSVGVLGFHWIESLDWVDATLNASMLLSGMGPIRCPESIAGKLFASFYALFSGVVFLTVAAILFAPVFHRLIHKFHLELDDESTRN